MQGNLSPNFSTPILLQFSQHLSLLAMHLQKSKSHIVVRYLSIKADSPNLFVPLFWAYTEAKYLQINSCYFSKRLKKLTLKQNK